jgi:hypothetical protein
MHGPDITTLLDVGSQHPVVVLTVDRDGYHAVLITSGDRPLTYIPLPSVTRDMLQQFTFEGLTSQRRGSDVHIDRGLAITKRWSSSRTLLAKLWYIVVQPILRQLSIPVRAKLRYHRYTDLYAADITRPRSS